MEENTNDNEILETFDDEELTTADNVEVKKAISDFSNINPGEHINHHLVPVHSINCIIPEKLLLSIQAIEYNVNKKFGSSNEFSIFIHGDWDADGNIVVSEKFYIPKQRVGGASVDYLEEPQEYYNGCLHKHPDGCKSFSGTDARYINSNFDFSLLYVCREIHKGIVNITYDGTHRIQCNLNIRQLKTIVYPDVCIDNIAKPEPVVVVGATRTPLAKYNSAFGTPVLPSFYNTNPVGSESEFEEDDGDMLNDGGADVPYWEL